MHDDGLTSACSNSSSLSCLEYNACFVIAVVLQPTRGVETSRSEMREAFAREEQAVDIEIILQNVRKPEPYKNVSIRSIEPVSNDFSYQRIAPSYTLSSLQLK